MDRIRRRTDLESHRWSKVLPVKAAHSATPITVLQTDGRQPGFVVPDAPAERVHNQILPAASRWNGGQGPHN